MNKWFKKDDYEYSIAPAAEQELFKVIHKFNCHMEPIAYGIVEDSESISSSQYLKGVADTMVNGQRMRDIATFIDNLRYVFSHVQARKIEEQP